VVLSAGPTSLSTSEAGGAATVRISASGITTQSSIVVNVTGLDATEGSLSATSLVLNALNGWAADLTVTGRGDRDADGAVSYALQVAAAGATGTSVMVVNANNDIAVSDIGSAWTADGRRLATATNASVAVLSADDGNAMRITEGGSKGSFATEWRFQFAGVTAGTAYKLQADVTSTESFTLDVYDASQAKWVALGTAGLSWTGDYTLSATAGTLQVRVSDAVRTSDSTRSDILVDLLTLVSVAQADQIL
jgi:hypothetical protein